MFDEQDGGVAADRAKKTVEGVRTEESEPRFQPCAAAVTALGPSLVGSMMDEACRRRDEGRRRALGNAPRSGTTLLAGGHEHQAREEK